MRGGRRRPPAFREAEAENAEVENNPIPLVSGEPDHLRFRFWSGGHEPQPATRLGCSGIPVWKDRYRAWTENSGVRAGLGGRVLSGSSASAGNSRQGKIGSLVGMTTNS